MLRLQLRHQPEVSTKLSFSTVTVGRDGSNSLVISDDSVSDFHIEITCEDHRFYLNDLLSANGTFVNDKRVAGRQELFRWDVLRIGQVELEVADPTQYRPGDWVLIPKSEESTKPFYALGQHSVLGRGAECDIAIDSPLISRRHAQLVIEDEQLRVTDLDSSNGTFLNGNRITESLVRPGDEIRFDQLVFQVDGPQLAPLEQNDIGRTMVRPVPAEPEEEKTQIALPTAQNQVADDVGEIPPVEHPPQSIQPEPEAISSIDDIPLIRPDPDEIIPQLDPQPGSNESLQPAKAADSLQAQPAISPVAPAAEQADDQTFFLQQPVDSDETQFLGQLATEPPPPEPPPEPSAFLVEVSEFLSERRVPLCDSDLLLGRGQDNQVVLPDSSVSKQHAKLSSADGQWQIEDLGARNGVQLNGAPVKSSRLQDGDRIKLGRIEFAFEAVAKELTEDFATVFCRQPDQDDEATVPVPRSKLPRKSAMPAWALALVIVLLALVAAVALFWWRSGGLPLL